MAIIVFFPCETQIKNSTLIIALTFIMLSMLMNPQVMCRVTLTLEGRLSILYLGMDRPRYGVGRNLKFKKMLPNFMGVLFGVMQETVWMFSKKIILLKSAPKNSKPYGRRQR